MEDIPGFLKIAGTCCGLLMKNIRNGSRGGYPPATPPNAVWINKPSPTSDGEVHQIFCGSVSFLLTRSVDVIAGQHPTFVNVFYEKNRSPLDVVFIEAVYVALGQAPESFLSVCCQLYDYGFGMALISRR